MNREEDARFIRMGTVEVAIFENKQALGRAAAADVIATVQKALSAREQAAVIFATGASQYEFLEALIVADGVDWSRVIAFHLDEYVGMSASHPASFRRYLIERLFNHLDFAAVHLLAGDAVDPAAECARYSELLAAQPIDLACIGIGENGHLAFNDPPADFHTQALVHVVDLDDQCRSQQVGEGHFPTLESVPPQALSLSIPAIMSAAAISCVAPDARKAAPVQAALMGPVTPTCPASILQRHADCRLYLDPGSAALLDVT